MQRALELYFTKGKWNEHIHYMQEIYRGKYEYMLGKLEGLKAYGVQIEKPDGELFFCLSSPIFFSHLDHLKDRYTRLSFAACSIDDIQKGMEILEECVKSLR